MDFLMLIFIISTLDAIEKHTFYLNQKKKFFMIPVGDLRAQNFFSSFFRMDPQTMIRTHAQLHSNKKIRILLGARKWPYPPSSFLLSLFNFDLSQVIFKFFTTNNFILYLDHFLQMRILLVFVIHEILSTRNSTTEKN
jgi:hypothetical protein